MVATQQMQRGLRVVQLDRDLALVVETVLLDQAELAALAGLQEIEPGHRALDNRGLENAIGRLHILLAGELHHRAGKITLAIRSGRHTQQRPGERDLLFVDAEKISHRAAAVLCQSCQYLIGAHLQFGQASLNRLLNVRFCKVFGANRACRFLAVACSARRLSGIPALKVVLDESLLFVFE